MKTVKQLNDLDYKDLKGFKIEKNVEQEIENVDDFKHVMEISELKIEYEVKSTGNVFELEATFIYDLSNGDCSYEYDVRCDCGLHRQDGYDSNHLTLEINKNKNKCFEILYLFKMYGNESGFESNEDEDEPDEDDIYYIIERIFDDFEDVTNLKKSK